MAACFTAFRISHCYTTLWQLRKRNAVPQGTTAVPSRKVMGVCAKGGNTSATNVAFQTRSLHLQRSCRVPSVQCCSANGFPVRQVPLYSASPSAYEEHKGSLHKVAIPSLSGEGLSIDQLLSKEDAGVPSLGANPEDAFEVFEGCEFKVPFHQAFHDASCPAQIGSEESIGYQGTMLGAAEANHLAEERAALEAAFYAPDSLQSHLLTLPPSTTRNFQTEEAPPLGTLQQVQNMFLGTAKLLGALVLAATLALCSPHPAMAARSMGRAGGGGFSSSRSSSSRGSSSRSSHGSSSRSSSSHGSSSRSSSSLGSSSRSSSSGSSSHSSYSSGGSPSRSSHSSRPSSSTWSSSLSSSPSVSSWSSESTTTWASPSPSYHRSQSSRRLANAVIDSLFGDGSPRAQSQATWQKQEQGTEQPRPNVAAGKTSEADKTTEAGKTAEADKTAKADETKEADEMSEWVNWLVGLVLFVSLLCVLRVLMTKDHGARRWGEKVGLSGDGLKVPLAAGGVQTCMSGADMRNMITIIKIQVAILGQAKSVQLQMDKLCEAADTSSKEGLHNLLTETLVVMLRHTAYWAYGNAQASAMGYDAAEMKFQQIALEERSKAEQETLVNKAGTLTKLPSIRNPDDEPLPNEYIVVTILAAIKGGLGLPESAHGAPSREKVRGAIQALSQVKADDVEVLEVLWVPQEDDDTLTHAELIENFTDLSPM